jgi:hypothetical protein
VLVAEEANPPKPEVGGVVEMELDVVDDLTAKGDCCPAADPKAEDCPKPGDGDAAIAPAPNPELLPNALDDENPPKADVGVDFDPKAEEGGGVLPKVANGVEDVVDPKAGDVVAEAALELFPNALKEVLPLPNALFGLDENAPNPTADAIGVDEAGLNEKGEVLLLPRAAG